MEDGDTEIYHTSRVTQDFVFLSQKRVLCRYIIKLINHLGKFTFSEVYRRIYCTIGNLVIRRHASGAVKRVSERISDDIPPQMKNLIRLFQF